jgi:outer membrane receptor protein involved in Fe transport
MDIESNARAERADRELSADRVDYSAIGDLPGARPSRWLGKSSVLALGCALFAQPAMAQPIQTAEAVTAEGQAQPDSPSADGGSADPLATSSPVPSASDASSAGDEGITVTGSRINNNRNSPTPITAVSVTEMAQTTPSDLADGLNKLPQIIGGRTPRTQGNGSFNNGGNVLSLRNFGPSRTLVLLDGHRVPAANQDGTVNIDTLPQMLVSRVEIVTGGASAIYGSDAVAGVVNFVLDKDFTGLLIKADAGISKYGDGEEVQFGVAWGTDLFGGRGHFETSARYRKQAMIPISARPYGKDGQAWLLAGNGSPANPFVNVPYSRLINSANFGTVNCGSACAFNGYTFNSPGELSPLLHGTPTGTANLQSGGDGGWVKYGTFRSQLEMKDWFGRFSYDLTSDVNVYAQASWAEARNASKWINWVVSPSANRPNTLFADNPFLAPATRQQLGAGIVCGTPEAAGWRCLPASPATSPQTGTTPPPPPTTPFFSAPSYIWNNVDGEEAGDTDRLYLTKARQRSLSAEVGATGSLGRFRWDVYYTHGESRNRVVNPNNTDNAKYLASLDAVIAPPGTMVNGVNVGGTVVCWVSTQPQFRDLYPGCVPTNITDPRGPSLASFNYLRQETSWVLTQKLDNISGSIGGDIGFGLPAGNIKANISGDMRWASYDMDSDYRPTEFVDCTGLRMCLANGGAPVRWVQNTNAEVEAKNKVWELAGEVNIPLLANLPLVQDLSTNLAGRYTKYSSFSGVKTWKAGVQWRVNDSLAFRGTSSLDIRAPNLNDLFQPAGVSSTGFRDLLTGGNNSLRLISRGNPNLTPEKARTITLGAVFTPTFIPGFTLSIDYYRTKMKNAITGITYQSDAVQNICLASAPAYDSPFCSLAIRPITNPADPNYRDPVLNFPTEILNSPLNAARQRTKGYEVQATYGFDMDKLVKGWGGRVSLKHLLSYQPVNTTINIPGSFPTWATQPKLRQTTFVSYDTEAWSLSLQNQWLGRVRMATSDNALNGNRQNYVKPYLPSFNLLDATVAMRFEALGGDSEAFLTVNNVLNARAPLFPSNSGIPGLFYPTTAFHDDMGRYYTVGVRAKF